MSLLDSLRDRDRFSIIALVALSLGYCASPEKLAGQTTNMERDKLYQAASKTLEELQATWKQQPKNVMALKRTSERLRSEIFELGRSEPEQAGPRPATTEGAKTGQAQAPSPQGPYRPSQRPSPEGEEERRRQATDRFLPGPPLEEEEVRTLRGVPEETIREACRAAERALNELDELLAESAPAPAAIGSALEKLESILREMAKPPPSTPR